MTIFCCMMKRYLYNLERLYKQNKYLNGSEPTGFQDGAISHFKIYFSFQYQRCGMKSYDENQISFLLNKELITTCFEKKPKMTKKRSVHTKSAFSCLHHLCYSQMSFGSFPIFFLTLSLIP